MYLQLFNRVRILTSWLGVLSISSLIAFPVYSQPNPVRLDFPNLGGTTKDSPPIRVTPGMRNRDGTDTYPYGSRISGSGFISTPRGEVTVPNVRINNGNGSTTYYYPNGSSVTIDGSKVPPTGTLLR
jgi:hypothetical protein